MLKGKIMSKLKGKWIRPATKYEGILEKFHEAGSMISSYWLRLSSKEPLNPDIIEVSLRHLFR